MRRVLNGSLFVVGVIALSIICIGNIVIASEVESNSSSSVVEEIESSTIELETIDSTSKNDTVNQNESSQKTTNRTSDDYTLKEKEKALNAGYTEEQFEGIMNIPNIESSPVIESRAALTSDQQKVVNMAKAQLGKPYSWGAEGPGSFDCGGLVRYVFKNSVGINIPMGTEVQRNYGKAVSMNSLLPGDLLFWLVKGTNTTEHVAIYIGNGQFIHSPTTGQTVSTVNMSYLNPNDWYPKFARRILPESIPQGNAITDGRYVTITKKGYSLWSSFDWNKKDSTDNLFNKTFQAKVRYKHENGSTYFSLYDSNGTWKGYLNSEAASVASGKQGIWLNNDKSVSITKKGYTIWGDINNFSSKTGNTDDHYQKNYYAQGKYNHFTGAVYLSLYDDQMKWIGYLNSEAAAVKQVSLTEISKTVMINRENKTIDTLPWGMSGYSKISSSPQHLGKVVTITQDSGSYAYSPELKGWIDKKGTTEVIKTNGSGTIQNAGYSIDPVPWYSGVTHIGYTKDHLNKKVTVTAKSGSYYYVANLGWMDKKAFDANLQKAVDGTANTNTTTNTKATITEINRSATVIGNGKTVDSLPWGMKGYIRVSSSNDYKGKTIRLTQDSGSYVYSPDLKGWIDKKGLTIK